MTNLHARQAAQAAQLHYVTDEASGIRRVRAGRGLRYVGPDGQTIRDPQALAWIRHLAIPPAWTGVWIYPHPSGHLQATGRDARGRKQSRYHPDWSAVRGEAKFTRMIPFGRALPKIRARARRDLARPGLPREKVLATIVRLLEITFIRVGNEEYARQNASFGLTTLCNRHVKVWGPLVRFTFRGKSGRNHVIDLNHPGLARVILRCRDLPGAKLFKYLDESGATQVIRSGDVNAYLRQVAGEEFSAKDFRTWGGTTLAALELRADKGEASKHRMLRAIERVAARLGNRPSACRKYYIHPAVLESYMAGTLPQEFAGEPRQALLSFLRRHAKPDRSKQHREP